MVYFPSCKYTAGFPEISQKIKEYLKNIHGASISGCCKPNLPKVKHNETAIYICNTCAAFLQESSGASKVPSIWEIIINDSAFKYPVYTDKTITLQDCWRARNNNAQMDAVRAVLQKMNIRVIEQTESRSNTKFCGYSLYEALPDGYNKLASELFLTGTEGFFTAHTQEEKAKIMIEHSAGITTEEVVCYCISCQKGLELGGKKVIHLSELLFGNTEL